MVAGLLAGLFAVLVVLTAPGRADQVSSYWQGILDVVGRDTAKRVGALDAAAAAMAKSGAPAKAAVLAANVSAEGHWTFVNREGQRFTAANAREMAQVVTNLAPDAAEVRVPPTLYLAGDAVFRHPEHIDLLPVRARLRMVVGEATFPMRAIGVGTEKRWLAELAPNLFVYANEKRHFGEAAWQLRRSMSHTPVRVLSLEPGGPETLTPRPKLSPGESVVINRVDPFKLARSISALRGQTAVITGRIERGIALVFRAPSGAERSISYTDLQAAAAKHDVNLVVLGSAAPRQPGARNWLWLRVEVDGLAEAMKRVSLGAFLGSVAGNSVPLLVEIRPRDERRVALSVSPLQSSGPASAPGPFGSMVSEVYSEVVGTVVSHAVDADLVSQKRQGELDRRLLPGVPSRVQLVFLAALVIGLLGLPVAWRWWGAIWPVEQREQYAGGRGYWLAQAIRFILFVAIFLPLVGVFAAVAFILGAFWRAARRMFGGAVDQTA